MDDPLKNIRIASPCQTTWEAMSGDDRVRHCSLCSLNVYNFAEMTRDEVRDLLLRSEGRVCARLYRRADGTIITRDCPSRLRTLRTRVSRVAATAIAALFSLSGFAADGKTCGKARIRRGSRVELAVEQAALSQKASFTGTVMFEQNALPGVSVLIRNEATRSERTAITDANGAFTILPPEDGLYRVEMRLEGFRPAIIEHLELKAGAAATARVTMQFDTSATVVVGAVAEPQHEPLTTTFPESLISKLPI